MHDLLLLGRQLLLAKVEGHLVDPAGELERSVVAVLDKRQWRAGVLPDVESLILREGDRRCVFHGIASHFFAVHGEHAYASLAKARTVGFKVEDDGVFAGTQLRPLPRRALEVEQVVEEHRLAPAESKLPLAQEQAVAAKAPSVSDDHAFRAAFGNGHLGRDGV